ncbi:MAG TPA: glycosyltransferase family 39 protein [Armatimonadota bacterium]|nr:glycosyltransferase family 39 protein [Armatimonadota bacterium]
MEGNLVTRYSSRPSAPWSWLIIVVLITGLCLLTTAAQRRQAPTYDEQNHVTRGIAILRTGDYRLSLHHPPLANILEALPVAWLHNDGFTTQMPAWRTCAIWPAARTTIWSHGAEGIHLIMLARLPVLVFVIVLAVIIFLWSRELFGYWGGVLSLLLLALDPNVLAHGGLVTTDIPAASTILLAMYCLRWYLKDPRWTRCIITGGVLGIAMATKFSGLVMLPISMAVVILAFCWPRYGGLGGVNHWVTPRCHRLRHAAGSLCMLWICAGIVIWGCYGFTVEPLGQKPGQPLSATATVIDRIPIPALQYFRGLKRISLDKQQRSMSFLGCTSRKGTAFWGYTPVVMITKTPLPELLVVLGILTLSCISHTRWLFRIPAYELWILLLPICIYILFAQMGSSLLQGIRHLLPLYPLLFILSGGWVRIIQAYPRAIVAFVLLFAFQGILLYRAYPDYLSYFNELAGGPQNGYRLAAGPNCDWGQDVERLARWQQQHHIPHLGFSYYGTTPPEVYGLHYTPLWGCGLMHRRGVKPNLATFQGYIAVSVTNLVNDPSLCGVDYRPLEHSVPYARVGNTIKVYKLPESVHRLHTR